MLNKSHQPFMLILSSPSGAGKTSICREVARRDKKIFYSVSVTTRPRRKGERNGKSYLFLKKREFQRLLKRGELLEWAEVYGHLYGTPKKPVLQAFQKGKDVIADLDIQGMRSCKRVLPGTVSIFILPPNLKEWKRRLQTRGAEDVETIKRREAGFWEEIKAIPEFDYLIINDKLEKAVRDVMSIINAERLRTERRAKTKEVFR